jgi:large subunit ribosomal protein L15
VRLLGRGEITRAVEIRLSGASATALAAVQAAGGKVILPEGATEDAASE